MRLALLLVPLLAGCATTELAAIRADLAALEATLPETERSEEQAAQLASIGERIDRVGAVIEAAQEVAQDGARAAIGGGPRDWTALGGSLLALGYAYVESRRQGKRAKEETHAERDAARRSRNEVTGATLARAAPPVAPPADLDGAG